MARLSKDPEHTHEDWPAGRPETATEKEGSMEVACKARKRGRNTSQEADTSRRLLQCRVKKFW